MTRLGSRYRLSQMLDQLMRRFRQRLEAAGADREPPVGPAVANPHHIDLHRARATPRRDFRHHRNADAGGDHLADRVEIVEPGAKAQPRAEFCRMPAYMCMQGARGDQADEIAFLHLAEIDLTPARQLILARGNQHQAVFAVGNPLNTLGQRMLGREPEIGGAGGDGARNLAAFALLDVDRDARMLGEEGGERLLQIFRKSRSIGEQVHAGPGAAGKRSEIAAQGIDIVHDDAGVIEQAFTGRGQFDAATAALEQGDGERRFQALDPFAGGRECQIHAARTPSDAASLGDGDKELQIDQIETHSHWHSLAFGFTEGNLRNLQIVPSAPIGKCIPVPDSMLILIAAALLLAGFIKGVLGLGLPTVAMGLLAVTMPPGRAIAIVIVPAIVTNIWQTFVGPYLRDIMRRLWPLMVGTTIATWLNAR